jgi:type IV secretion system protein TrbL
MGDLNVLDQFTQTFIRYVDSGFGLLNGEVAYLTSVLVGIDITLAGLHWALDDGNVVARLLRKVLYVGTFALILNNWPAFANTIFSTFSGLGLKAAPTQLTAAMLLQPGFVAGTGFDAAYPLLQQASALIGFTTFYNHMITIFVLFVSWLVVILAFFILAVQLFITIIEFKLTTLAGFVLVPFALWNKTVFLSERVLGNVIASGIKVMVLAVIIGIGTTLFGQFTTPPGTDPTLAQAMSLVLGAIALFGLGIFGPGIAAGLVSGAPQLGAGAAIGTAGALAAAALIGGGFAVGAARAGAGAALTAVRAGTALGSGAASSYSLARAASGATGRRGVAAGLGGVASASRGALAQAVRGFGGRLAGGSSGAADPVPDWARRLQAEQRFRSRAHTTMQAVKDGDRPGAGSNPNLTERD